MILMSDKITESLEQPGKQVAWRRVPISADIEIVDSVADLGEPSSEKTIEELEALTAKLSESYTQKFGSIESVDEDTLKKITGFVNQTFPFRSHWSGVSTLPKQIEYYNSHQLEELPEGLDCKLATVMTGLLVSNLSIRSNIETQVFIASRYPKIDSHPSLLVEIPGNPEEGNLFFVDYHTERPPKDKVSAQEFSSEYEKDKYILENSKSGFTVKPLEETGKEVFRRGAYKKPIVLETLRELDQTFLDD